MLYSRYEARWDLIYQELGMRLIYICDRAAGDTYEMWDMTHAEGFYHHDSVPSVQCRYAQWFDWKKCKMEVTFT